MSDSSSFVELVRRLRTGDQEAAAELVRQYEPEIRRAMRVRLKDSQLRRTLDSIDICQSVLANFFVRAAAGQFDLAEPQDLLKLLMKMAQNKLYDHARRQSAGRRDYRRMQTGDSGILAAVPGAEDTPSQIVAGRELLDAVYGQLTPEECYLAQQRAQGREWEELAAELAATPDALRKKLTRAIDRAAKHLGIEESPM